MFIGGANFQLSISSGNVGGVAWFPLGPREVYQPAYPVSRRYYEDINRSNTVINNTVINNTYNTTTVNVGSFANHTVKGAVIAVPKTAFVQSQPVARVAQQSQLVARALGVADGGIEPLIDLLERRQFQGACTLFPHAVHGANAFEDLAHQGRFGGIGKALVVVPP